MSDKHQPAPSGFVDIELARPIEVSGVQVSTLRMREPTVGDQMAVDDIRGTDGQREVSLIANLCEIAPDDVKRLTLRDYRKVQEAFAGFVA